MEGIRWWILSTPQVVASACFRVMLRLVGSPRVAYIYFLNHLASSVFAQYPRFLFFCSLTFYKLFQQPMFPFYFNLNAHLLCTFVILHRFTIHTLCFPFIAVTRTYGMTSNVSNPKSSRRTPGCDLHVSPFLTRCRTLVSRGLDFTIPKG